MKYTLMMRKLLILVLVTCLADPLLAHHSDAIYDRESLIAFEAKVVKYSFRNPHVQILVETEDEKGQKTEWDIETGSTPIMIRSGWTRGLIEPGDIVSIRAHPERSGKNTAILNTMTTDDGKIWSQIENDPIPTTAATSLAGVWRGETSTFLGRQLNAQVLTAKATSAKSSYDRVNNSPTARCITLPPPFLNASLTYLTEIEILDDRIFLRNEFLDMERTVHMDGRQHPENGKRTNMGHSIGWWEGDVLVIDTKLLDDHIAGNNRDGVPSGAGKHVVERFSLSDDGMRIMIDILIEDPEYLAEPFVAQTTLVHTPQHKLVPYNCPIKNVEQ